jgi:hypothetical protein
MTETNPQGERCSECGEAMALVDTPVERSVCWFGVELIVRRWTKVPYCVDCASDHDAAWQQAVWDSGVEYGYDEGWRDALARSESWKP